MPWYDYQCKKCGLDLPIHHSIHDDARETEDHMSPNTGKKCKGKLKRLISAAMVTWKNGPPTGKHYV